MRMRIRTRKYIRLGPAGPGRGAGARLAGWLARRRRKKVGLKILAIITAQLQSDCNAYHG